MKINLHIERLVLDGMPIDRTQGGKLRAAVEQELTHLLADGGLWSGFRNGGSVPVLRAGNIRIREGVGAGPFGKQVAESVHENLTSGIGVRNRK